MISSFGSICYILHFYRRCLKGHLGVPFPSQRAYRLSGSELAPPWNCSWTKFWPWAKTPLIDHIQLYKFCAWIWLIFRPSLVFEHWDFRLNCEKKTSPPPIKLSTPLKNVFARNRRWLMGWCMVWSWRPRAIRNPLRFDESLAILVFWYEFSYSCVLVWV